MARSTTRTPRTRGRGNAAAARSPSATLIDPGRVRRVPRARKAPRDRRVATAAAANWGSQPPTRTSTWSRMPRQLGADRLSRRIVPRHIPTGRGRAGPRGSRNGASSSTLRSSCWCTDVHLCRQGDARGGSPCPARRWPGPGAVADDRPRVNSARSHRRRHPRPCVAFRAACRRSSSRARHAWRPASPPPPTAREAHRQRDGSSGFAEDLVIGLHDTMSTTPITAVAMVDLTVARLDTPARPSGQRSSFGASSTCRQIAG